MLLELLPNLAVLEVRPRTVLTTGGTRVRVRGARLRPALSKATFGGVLVEASPGASWCDDKEDSLDFVAPAGFPAGAAVNASLLAGESSSSGRRGALGVVQPGDAAAVLRDGAVPGRPTEARGGL